MQAGGSHACTGVCSWWETWAGIFMNEHSTAYVVQLNSWWKLAVLLFTVCIYQAKGCSTLLRTDLVTSYHERIYGGQILLLSLRDPAVITKSALKDMIMWIVLNSMRDWCACEAELIKDDYTQIWILNQYILMDLLLLSFVHIWSIYRSTCL